MSSTFMADLLARRVTRLAAVQALVAAETLGEEVFDTLEASKDLLGLAGVRGDEEPGDEAPQVFEELERGWAYDGVQKARQCWAQRSELDAEIASRLNANWTLERLNTTLRAALRFGLFEKELGEVEPKVAVTEAIEVTRALADEASVAMVCALLIDSEVKA